MRAVEQAHVFKGFDVFREAVVADQAGGGDERAGARFQAVDLGIDLL
jgi:hypothetical protein